MKIGSIVSAKIEKIFTTYAIVSLKEGYEGLIHVANISDYYVASINGVFKIGEKYDFEVIELDEEKKWVKLSWKTIVPRFQKNPFDYAVEETKNGFENLKRKTEEEVQND